MIMGAYEDILAELYGILKPYVEGDLELREGTDLVADIGLDSMHVMNLLLEVEDRLGMASSVEIRCPLCDYRLVEYVFSLPFDRKFRRNEEKALLRDAFRADLPQQTLQRKKSQFPIPMQSGQFYRHVGKTLTRKNLHIHEYFRRDRLKELCTQLAKRPIAAVKYVAFRLYTLERWHEKFLV